MISTDASQEQHAAVEVHAVDATHQLARQVPHGPPVLLTVDHQRQGHNEQDVSDGHIQQTHVSHGLGSLVESVRHDHKGIDDETNKTNDRVNKQLEEVLNALSVQQVGGPYANVSC